MRIQQQAMTRDCERSARLDGTEIEGMPERPALSKTFDANVDGPAGGPSSLENAKHSNPIPRR